LNSKSLLLPFSAGSGMLSAPEVLVLGSPVDSGCHLLLDWITPKS